jgi:hypothetical protein
MVEDEYADLVCGRRHLSTSTSGGATRDGKVKTVGGRRLLRFSAAKLLLGKKPKGMQNTSICTSVAQQWFILW